MSFKQESIQLVSCNQHQEFRITQQAKCFLKNVDKPISIITISGIYRTGKSYLINKLIKNKTNGFQISSNIQPKTKGLNIWGRPILAYDQKGNQIYYLVIDSQGMGSSQRSSKYDSKLLMLIFLISSTVVFNSMGAIDQIVLDQLSAILKMKDSIAIQEQKEKPKLVWILRDFSLQLINKQGQAITQNQYLQSCLQYLKGNSSDIRRKNQIRKAIKQGFKKRQCFTLVRPTIQQSYISDLSKCHPRTQFLKQIQQIREYIFSGSSQDLKIINKSYVNGQILSKYIQKALDSINNNQQIQIKQISQYITQQYKNQLFDGINIDMQAEIQKINLPLPYQQIKFKLNQIQNKFYKKIQQISYNIDDFKKYYRQFLKITNKINKQISQINKKIIKDKLKKEVRQFIKDNIDIDNIQPTNLTIIKPIIQRILLKIKDQPQSYNIVLQILFKIMQKSQQKAISMHKQNLQQKNIIELSYTQRKNIDFNGLSIKRQLHESLQIINNLKLTQQQLQKQLCLSNNQIKIISNQLSQHKTIQNQTIVYLNKLIQQNYQKYKHKLDEQLQSIKMMREENIQLQNQISCLKTQRLCQTTASKQFIFQQKIRQILSKKQRQIQQLHETITKKQNNYQQLSYKYKQLLKQKQQISLITQKQIHKYTQKQRQYQKQLKQIKQLHTQNKKTYNQTLSVMKQQRILKNIQNLSYSNIKQQTSCKKITINQQKQITRKYQDIIQKLKIDFQQKQLYANQKFNKIKQSNQILKKKYKDTQGQLQRLQKDKNCLQSQLLQVKQKFANNLSLIEINKQKQRSFYQESIVRLLSNLDRKESSRQYFTQKR